MRARECRPGSKIGPEARPSPGRRLKKNFFKILEKVLDIASPVWYNIGVLRGKKGRNKMKKLIEKIENNTARRYGLEAKRTIRVFRMTEKVRKIFRVF